MHDDAAALQAQQRAFAAHIRDPARNAAPAGIEDRRLKIYRDLFFNSLESLLAGNYPVICATLGNDAWRELVRAFYANHRCTTPLFTEIGKEFVDWLASGEHDIPPWLPELAHYEWVELALSIADVSLPEHDAAGDLLDGVPILSPVAWPLAYAWPVTRIAPDNIPDAPGDTPTLLLVRRDPAGVVRFSELSGLAYLLLQRIGENDTATGRELLRNLATEAGAADLAAFEREGAAMLQRLHEDHVLLGTRPRC